MLHRLLASIFLLLFCTNVYAHKVSLLGGIYSFSAETSASKATVSNWGVYSFEYMIPFYKQLDFHFGYTVNMEKGISGDIAYGLDLGVYYYPVTKTSNTYFQTPTISLTILDKFKPFVGVSFHQRQFQSIRTSYAGFGITAGSEYALWKRSSLSASLRLLSLKGPEDSTASLIEIFTGFVFSF